MRPWRESGLGDTPPSAFVRKFDSPRVKGEAKWYLPHVLAVVLVHLLATLALVPWLFSWTGVAFFFVGCFLFGTVGLNLGYHRLLSHRSFKCPKWFEHAVALSGVCALQGTPGRWVALHRIHHQYSDQEEDPHTPLVSFLWSHLEWTLTEDRRNWFSTYGKYAPDLMRDQFYLHMERGYFWVLVYLIHAASHFAVGLAIGWLSQRSAIAGVQLGASILVWGVFLRTVYVWHATWSVNSITHTFGYRNYETVDQSRNNWLVALLVSGEGWHNNHHADAKCAAAGHRWWEFDLTFMVIRGLALVGLAYDVVPRRVASADRPQLAIVRADGSRSIAVADPISSVGSSPDLGFANGHRQDRAA